MSRVTMSSNGRSSDGNLFGENISLEFILAIENFRIYSMLNDSRTKAVGSKTNCHIQLTTRILNKRISLYRWRKYAIIKITGPDEDSINQCLRLLERQFPIFLHRREYARRADVTIFTNEITLPDNIPGSTKMIRSGSTMSCCQGLATKSPFVCDENRPSDITVWKRGKSELEGRYSDPMLCQLTCQPPISINTTRMTSVDSVSTKLSKNEIFGLLGIITTNSQNIGYPTMPLSDNVTVRVSEITTNKEAKGSQTSDIKIEQGEEPLLLSVPKMGNNSVTNHDRIRHAKESQLSLVSAAKKQSELFQFAPGSKFNNHNYQPNRQRTPSNEEPGIQNICYDFSSFLERKNRVLTGNINVLINTVEKISIVKNEEEVSVISVISLTVPEQHTQPFPEAQSNEAIPKLTSQNIVTEKLQFKIESDSWKNPDCEHPNISLSGSQSDRNSHSWNVTLSSTGLQVSKEKRLLEDLFSDVESYQSEKARVSLEEVLSKDSLDNPTRKAIIVEKAPVEVNHKNVQIPENRRKSMSILKQKEGHNSQNSNINIKASVKHYSSEKSLTEETVTDFDSHSPERAKLSLLEQNTKSFFPGNKKNIASVETSKITNDSQVSDSNGPFKNVLVSHDDVSTTLSFAIQKSLDHSDPDQMSALVEIYKSNKSSEGLVYLSDNQGHEMEFKLAENNPVIVNSSDLKMANKNVDFVTNRQTSDSRVEGVNVQKVSGIKLNVAVSKTTPESPNGVYVKGMNEFVGNSKTALSTTNEKQLDSADIATYIAGKLKNPINGTLFIMFDGRNIFSTGSMSMAIRPTEDDFHNCCYNFESSNYAIAAKCRNGSLRK